MDMPRNDIRPVELDEFSTPKHLEHASEQARERNYQDFLIVDVDSHHYENENYAEVFEYIESPVIRREAIEGDGRRTGLLNTQVGYAEHCPAASSEIRSAASKSRASQSIATSA